MKYLITNWILPLLLAIVLVVVVRIMFVSTITVNDNTMRQTILSGEKIYYIKSVSAKRNAIVIFKPNNQLDSLVVKRQIAIPGDTVKISNSIVYVNNKRLGDEAGVSYNYTFRTDSIVNTSNYLVDHNLSYDFRRSYLGLFSCNTNLEGLKTIGADPLIKNIKREFSELSVARRDKPSFGSVFYWNADNLGPIIIPGKGMQVKMGRKAFLLYKEIIEKETGELVDLQSGKCIIGNRITDHYTFKRNYFFLLNDNRSNYNDSRTFGFVAEGQIVGRYLFKI